MLNIGIDDEEGFFYEGKGTYGRAIWPSPIITPARIALPSDGPPRAVPSSNWTADQYRFREDYFDPVSHIRRGRFYTTGNASHAEWHVQPHPAKPQEASQAGSSDLIKRLETFHGTSIWTKFFRKAAVEQPMVIMGLDERFTIWAIVNLEVISTGEELVTLKARQGIGILPDIDTTEIPDTHAADLLQRLEKFVDCVHRADPQTVIDRARDAASQTLLALYRCGVEDAKDLSKMAARLEDDKKHVAANIARILAKLHSRGKPSEQARRPTMRSVREKDAQFAAQCVGMLLCEIGWADWR